MLIQDKLCKFEDGVERIVTREELRVGMVDAIMDDAEKYDQKAFGKILGFDVDLANDDDDLSEFYYVFDHLHNLPDDDLLRINEATNQLSKI